MDTQAIENLKAQMCDIGRRIWDRGFCAGNGGNHSVRIGPDRLLATPTGLSKGFMDPDDIITVDLEGNMVMGNARGRRPTSELKLHLAIYQAHPEVSAVVHSHPPHATAFAIAGLALPEGLHPEAEVFLGQVPIASYATPSTWDLPARVLEVIQPGVHTVMMANHGTVSFSHSLEDAYYKLEMLDAYCRILLLVKQIGVASPLSVEQMQALMNEKEHAGLADPRLGAIREGQVGGANEKFMPGMRIMGATQAGGSADAKESPG